MSSHSSPSVIGFFFRNIILFIAVFLTITFFIFYAYIGVDKLITYHDSGSWPEVKAVMTISELEMHGGTETRLYGIIPMGTHGRDTENCYASGLLTYEYMGEVYRHSTSEQPLKISDLKSQGIVDEYCSKYSKGADMTVKCKVKPSAPEIYLVCGKSEEDVGPKNIVYALFWLAAIMTVFIFVIRKKYRSEHRHHRREDYMY